MSARDPSSFVPLNNSSHGLTSYFYTFILKLSNSGIYLFDFNIFTCSGVLPMIANARMTV